MLDSNVAIVGPDQDNLLQQCSRWAPVAEQLFKLIGKEVTAAEQRLAQVSQLTANRCSGQSSISEPGSYLRQCVGYVANGERFLYLNALKMTSGLAKNKAQIMCDGGDAALGAVFSLE